MSDIAIKNARKIIITGCTAVGKSSVVKAVEEVLRSKHIPCCIVPEYIDYRADGLEMLNKYFDKSISVFEFQNYILDHYEDYLSHLKIEDGQIIIFERSMDDGITCFSNMDNKNGELSDLEFYQLYERARSIDMRYNIPSYFMNKDAYYVGLETANTSHIGKLIDSILGIMDHTNFIVGLYNDDETCYKRMLKRDRKGETDAYTKEYMIKINKLYKKLYKILQSKRNMRFVDLGKLL